MKDSIETNMCLMTVSGRIKIKVSEKYLIDKGILAKQFFLYRKIGYVPDSERLDKELTGRRHNFQASIATPCQKDYPLSITYYIARNRAIVNTDGC